MLERMINQAALELLNKQEFMSAQRLFFRNAHKHPSHQTYNNLGIFLLTEGFTIFGGKTLHGHKLGLHFLRKASTLKTSQINLCAIAKAYDDSLLRTVCHKRAHICQCTCAYLEEALHIEYSDIIMYNVLRAKYLLGVKGYSLIAEAERLLAKSLCSESVSLYFGLLQLNLDLDNSLACIERYREYLSDDDLLMFYSKFSLYGKGYELCATVVNDYFPDGNIFSAVTECCVNSGHHEELSAFSAQIFEIVNDLGTPSYKKKLSVELCELKNSAKKREELIRNYLPTLPFMDLCYYFGCQTHNTAWEKE